MVAHWSVGLEAHWSVELPGIIRKWLHGPVRRGWWGSDSGQIATQLSDPIEASETTALKFLRILCGMRPGRGRLRDWLYGWRAHAQAADPKVFLEPVHPYLADHQPGIGGH